MVKQESQRRERDDLDARPDRCESSTEVQKQVGQTMVQLPQVRQRSATSSQRGCSRLAAAARAGRPSASAGPSRRPCAATTASRRVQVAVRRRARAAAPPAPRLPASRAGLDEKPVLALGDLGQRQVESGLGLGPGVHRDAEAGPARLAAVDRDDEGALAPRLRSADRRARRRGTPGPGWRSPAARRRARR